MSHKGKREEHVENVKGTMRALDLVGSNYISPEARPVELLLISTNMGFGSKIKAPGRIIMGRRCSWAI